MRKILIPLLAAMLALGAVACGSDDDNGSGDTGGSESGEIPGGADPGTVDVIDGWSTALSEGDVEAAADFFEIPSVAENGTPELALESRDDVIAFNEALPCGAELTEAVEHAGFVIATFELTERPGGDCGPGVGGEAQTAFQIDDGKILEWRRTGGAPVEPQSDAPIV